MNEKQLLTRILPMGTSPINSYPEHSNMLSILMNDPCSLAWFYESYIQLFAEKNIEKYCFADFYAPLSWKACPWLDFQKISRDLIERGWPSITAFLMDAIDIDHYVFIHMNRFYFPPAWSYKVADDNHETLFFGYNKTKGIFNTADFYGTTSFGQYQHAEISFANVKSAFENTDMANVHDYLMLKGAVLLKPVKYEKYLFKINRVIAFITDYLNSTTSTNGYTDGYRQDVNENPDAVCFGLEVYDVLTRYLKEKISTKNSIEDIRAFQALYEHKVLMIMRLKYLTDQGMLKGSMQLIEDYTNLKEEVWVIRNSVLKGFIAQDKEMYAYAVKCLDKIKQNESKLLENVLLAIS